MEKKTSLLPLILLVCAAFSQAAVISDADWPMPGHDMHHSGYSNASSELALEDIGLLRSFEQKGELSSPVTADLNNDGKAEILLGSTDNNLYCLSWDAKELWRFEASGVVASPSVFDLTGDNISEILVASKDGTIYALDNNGGLLWSYLTNGSITSTPMAVNLDYKPELEIVVPSDDKYLYVLDYSGKLYKKYLVADPFLSTVCVGDMNLDGKPDFFMGAYNNKMDGIVSPESRRMAFDTTGQVSTPVYVSSGPDGKPRMVLSSGDGKIFSLYYDEYTKIDEGHSNDIVKYTSLTQEWQYNLSGEVSSSPSVSDLDDDGFSEIIVGTTNKILYIFDSQGNILEKHSINGKILSSPVTADLDGDLYPEIIFGSSDGLFSILNGSGFRKWSYDSNSIINRDAAVSDLDRDGKLEVLFSAGNKLYVFGEKKAAVATTTLAPARTTSTSTSSSTTTSTTTTSSSTTLATPVTLSVTSTTLSKEAASVGFNDFIFFLVALTVAFLLVGMIAKFLHKKVTKKVSPEIIPLEKRDTGLQGIKDIQSSGPSGPLVAQPPPVKTCAPLSPVHKSPDLAGVAGRAMHGLFKRKEKKAVVAPAQEMKDASLQDMASSRPLDLSSPFIAKKPPVKNTPVSPRRKLPDLAALVGKPMHNLFKRKEKKAATVPVQEKAGSNQQDPSLLKAPVSQSPLIPPVKTLEEKNLVSTIIEIFFISVSSAKNFLQTLFARREKKNAKPAKTSLQEKKETSLQDIPALKRSEEIPVPDVREPPKSPLIASEEKTVEEYRQALQVLIDKEKTLPAKIDSESKLPALEEEHKEFLEDLKTLEKEGKRKYVL